MSTYNKYGYENPTFIGYTNQTNSIIKTDDGKQVYLGFEDIDKLFEGKNNISDEIQLYDNDYSDKVNGLTVTAYPSDNTNTGSDLRYTSTSYKHKYQVAYKGIKLFQLDIRENNIILFEITVNFLIETRLLDDTSDNYDVYVSTVSLTLSQLLPFKLNVCVNLVYDSTLDDGSIDLTECIEGYDWYFDVNTTVGKAMNNNNNRPNIILNKGNGQYGFHSIEFLDSTSNDYRFVGPGSTNNHTNEYAEIIYENKIYRCSNVNFSPNDMIY